MCLFVYFPPHNLYGIELPNLKHLMMRCPRELYSLCQSKDFFFFLFQVILIHTRYFQDFHGSLPNNSLKNSSLPILLWSFPFSKILHQNNPPDLHKISSKTVTSMKYLSFHAANSNSNISSSKIHSYLLQCYVACHTYILRLHHCRNMQIFI